MITMINPKLRQERNMKTQINLIKQLRETADSLEQDLEEDLVGLSDLSLLRDLEWEIGVNGTDYLYLKSTTAKNEKGHEFLDRLREPKFRSVFNSTVSASIEKTSSAAFGVYSDHVVIYVGTGDYFAELIATTGPLDITNIEEMRSQVQDIHDTAEKRGRQWDAVVEKITQTQKS